MKRRQLRVSKGAYAESSDSEGPMDPEPSVTDTDVFKPPTKSKGKKRKVTNETDVQGSSNPPKRFRRKKGVLERLVEMPMDVLFEIFGQLKPFDLVNLARTTKALRNILMSRSSITVWRDARSNIEGLPDCPKDLTEPQYAILMFDRACSFCHRNLAIVHTAWSARVRSCNKCLNSQFVRYWTWKSTNDIPSPLIPWTICLRLPKNTSRRGQAPFMVEYTLRSMTIQLKSDYAAVTSPERKYEWLLQRLEEQYAIHQHSRECQLWYKRYCDKHYGASERLEDDRKLEILKHVKKLGFEEEVSKLSPIDLHGFMDHSSVKLAYLQPITETSLSNLEEFLVPHLKRMKTGRERLLQDALLEARKPLLLEIHARGIQNLPVDSVYPNIGEIHQMAEENGFLDYSKSNSSDALRIPFTEIFALWKKDVDKQLVDRIANGCGPSYVFDSATVLDLATTFFHCSKCSESGGHEPMHYEQAVSHAPCLFYSSLQSEVSANHRLLCEVFHAGLRSFKDLKFRRENWECMCRVVSMAGLDPRTATSKEMDDKDPIFECRSCNDIDEGRATMTWAAVGNHWQNSHSGADARQMILELLHDPEVSDVRRRIREEQERATHKAINCLIVCPHCRTVSKTLKVYRTHVEREHEVMNVTTSKLIFSPQQNRIPALYRLWPPRDKLDDEQDETRVIFDNFSGSSL